VTNLSNLTLVTAASHILDAVILRRLHIGHTCVTHRYLLTGQPLCDKCKCSCVRAYCARTLQSNGYPWKVLHVQLA